MTVPSELERLTVTLLVIRGRAGDVLAFTALVERFHVRLCGYVGRLLGDPDVAADVLQDVWIEVYRGLPRLVAPEAFAMWLYRIARNLACQQLRRRARWVPLADGPERIAPDDARPSEEELAGLQLGLERLSAPHRDVLLLHHVCELSYEEIAELIGCPLGTVRSRLYHARRALRRAMEETPCPTLDTPR